MPSSIRRRRESDIYITAGLTAVILYFLASTYVTYQNIRTIQRDSDQVTQTHDTILSLNNLMSLMKDAETGQRGYVLTGEASYLDPYKRTLPLIETEMANMRQLMRDDPERTAKIDTIAKHVDNKIAELQQTIELRRTKGFDAALAVIISDNGKHEMDIVRSISAEIERDETEIRNQRIAEREQAYRLAITSGLITGLLGLGISIAVGILVRRVSLHQKKEDWLNNGQLGVGSTTFGEMHIQQLGNNILSYLSNYFGAQAGVFYYRNNGHYERAATYGVPDANRIPQTFKAGEGLLGQTVTDNKPRILSDLPDNYLYFGSAMGESRPQHLLLFPVTAENSVNGVIELGFPNAIDPIVIELMKKVSEIIGIAIRSVSYRVHLQNLLEETQRQSEELQAQSEELKVSNEELEEQSRMLKESQVRLEQQQVEMEQTNSQLEEQTQLLEAQRDDLEKSRSLLQQKAKEIEQASQYKSSFLANMSHELRTPLNSSLILAKLLADNPEGNLSEEQVKYAQTIQSSGNDLLTLINDILDLSKIEAGHMDIRPETTSLARLASDIRRMFEPIAAQKRLDFKVNIGANCSETIITDRQRLEQIIKNLISNAIKFTEKGSVDFTVSCADSGMLSFAVRDTGIGISPQQQASIFEAFKQADGTISRKYGGTGLGLSISRELARLLGGRIELASEESRGSTFTVFLPETYQGASTGPASHFAALRAQPSPTPLPVPAAIAGYRQIADDRAHLKEGVRTLLIIEDDESFARILYDLGHELHFQCLVATTAEDGLIATRQYLPSAVLLDVGLPDNSGLYVLDRLKHDTRTRHIPVHVISGNDYSQTAYSLGAAGYMLKPVKRDELTEALKRIEARFMQRMRHVLIVEDDWVQRESVEKLLSSHEVETVAVGTAAECLNKLKEGSYDCMVLDLSLPDASGYQLLETLSQEIGYSFPPVIVYTGRDLSQDEEQRLRRYSKSIIIKGAKSPERLLDEVTLFLHQVVSELPPEQQRMLAKAKSRDSILEGRHILVVEDDVRNVYAVTSILEPQGVKVHIARNGIEGLQMLENEKRIDLVLMDVMMPEMDGLTATREIRKRQEWKKLPIIMLTAKAMKDDQERCIDAGANDYMAKPLDVEKLLSLVRVWMPR